jgi:hypothetical protein
MNDENELVSTCVCGHAIEEHGDDPKYPASTACNADGCDCIAYELDDIGAES